MRRMQGAGLAVLSGIVRCYGRWLEAGPLYSQDRQKHLSRTAWRFIAALAALRRYIAMLMRAGDGAEFFARFARSGILR